jgi:hypothetical protein
VNRYEDQRNWDTKFGGTTKIQAKLISMSPEMVLNIVGPGDPDIIK